MNNQRLTLTLWMLLGCVVFTAVGLQLVGNAWALPALPIQGTLAQSPAPNSVGVEVVPVESLTAEASATDTASLILYLAIFVLAIFVGFEVITKVPPTLHTPLMSGSNAISGITLVGAILVAGQGWHGSSIVGMLAVALAMINVVGGFLVTHRMLSMFQAKKRTP